MAALLAWLIEVGLSFRALLTHGLLVLGVVIVEMTLNALAIKATELKLLTPALVARVEIVTSVSVGPLLGILGFAVCVIFALQAWDAIASQFHRVRVAGLYRRQEREELEEMLKLKTASTIAVAKAEQIAVPPKPGQI